MRAPTGSRPLPLRLLVRSREYRRPRVWITIRRVCGIFNMVLSVLLFSLAHWIGPLAWLGLIPLAGAALIFWTVRDLRHSVQG